MRVILKETVENLGTVGDVVKVSDGYARNFLLPRKLVVEADEGKVTELNHFKRILEKKRLSEKSQAEELGQKVSEIQITLKRKVGKGDKLFGSVTAGDIFQEFEMIGVPVQKSQIHLKEPLRTLGVHKVDVRLMGGVTAQVKVWIAKEE
jgi:large subunit ribosomal protein L9